MAPIVSMLSIHHRLPRPPRRSPQSITAAAARTQLSMPESSSSGSSVRAHLGWKRECRSHLLIRCFSLVQALSIKSCNPMRVLPFRKRRTPGPETCVRAPIAPLASSSHWESADSEARHRRAGLRPSGRTLHALPASVSPIFINTGRTVQRLCNGSAAGPRSAQ